MAGKLERQIPVYFAKEDKLEFLNIISKYKNFFENNDLSAYNIKRKKDFWMLIEREYNEISPKTGPRTAEQLQSLYKNLKRKARNDALREIESIKSEHCISIEESTDDTSNYLFLKPQIRNSDCVSEAVESSTSTNVGSTVDNDYVIEPHITLESLQNSVSSRSKRNYSETLSKNSQIEPVSSTKRVCDEECKLKLKILRTELETKRKEANINYEICLLRKEVEWKKKETALLRKKAKLEEIEATKALLQLQQENELLRRKLLQIEVQKARQSVKRNSNNKNEDS